MKMKMSIKKQFIIAFTLIALTASLFPVSPVEAALTINDNTGWAVAVPQNGQFDYVKDQQTAVSSEVSQDIVGGFDYTNNYNMPAFQTKYDSASNEIGFKIRLNNYDGQNPQQAAFKNFAYVGVDVSNPDGTFDGRLDFFLGIYNVNNNASKNRGRIGIYNTDPTKLNSSPSTTGIINPAIIQYPAIKDSNFNFQEITPIKNGNVNYNIIGAYNDWHLSFKVPVDDINLAMQRVRKTTRVTAKTAMRYIVGTASQDNSFNQDVAGLQGLNANSTTTWTDLGAFLPPTNFSNSGVTVNFLDTLTSSLFTSINTVAGYSLGVLPTIPNSGSNYFAGWSKTSGSGAADFLATTPVTDNVTVYSVWKSSSVSIKYFRNETTSDTTVLQTFTIADGSVIGANVPPTPSRTGYTFLGWNTQPNGSGTNLKPADVLSSSNLPSGETTFKYYAQWAQSYVVSFNYDGGKDDSDATSTPDLTIIKDSTIGSMPALTKISGNTTYYLLGWKDTTTGDWYTGSTPITKTVTLTAQWITLSYQARFLLNDGTSTVLTTYKVAYTTAGQASAPLGILPIPQDRTGYLFDGWYTQDSGGERINETQTLTKDTDFFAHWTSLSIVTFHLNDGTTSSTTREVYTGSSLGSLPTPPQRTGYTFMGWTLSISGGTTFNETTVVSRSLDVYAQWQEGTNLPTSTVTFHSNFDPDSTSTKSTYTNSYLSELPFEPIRSGYVFTGWNTQIDGLGSTFNLDTKVTDSLQVYAQWISDTNPMAYHANGAIGTLPATEISYKLNSVVTIKGNVGSDGVVGQDDLTKTGYTFAGWNTAANGTGTSVTAGSTFIMPAYPVTLYAQWTANPHTVTYVDTYHTAGSVPSSVNTSYNQVFSVAAQGDLARTGYTFSGWLNSYDSQLYKSDTSKLAFTVYQDTTLTAQWTINNYTITFNENYGANATSSKTAAYQSTLTGNMPAEPTQTGYLFSGWYTKNGTGGDWGSLFDASTTVVGDATVYAKWTLNSKTITYVGGTDATGSTDSSTAGYGLPVTIRANGFTKAGYSFTSWLGSDGKTYKPGDTPDMPESGLTLTAQWTALDQTITYAGGEGSSGTMTNTVEKTGESTQLSTNSYTKTGYSFTGWKDAQNNSYAAGATFNMPAGGLTLTAQWTINNYTITFNENYGANATSSKTAAYQSTLTGNMPAEPTQTGYLFSGWYTKNGTEGDWGSLFDASTTVVGDATVYAKWTLNSKTITYVGGPDTSGSTDSSTAGSGLPVTIRANGFTKAGYSFTSWLGSDGKTYKSGDTPDMPESGLILTAQWTALDQTITYTGGEGSSGTMTNTVKKTGESTQLSTNSFTKTGYTFTGWKDAQNNSYAAEATFNMPAGGLTLTAQWTINKKTVTYNSNLATGGSLPASDQEYEYAATVSVLGNSGSLTRTGYTFTGWNTQADGQGTDYPMTNPSNSFTMGNTPVTLYARWIINKYDVSFDKNGADGTAPSTINQDFGTTVTLPGNTNSAMTKTGFVFGGWSTQSNGGGTRYAAGATFNMPENGRVLYAIWNSPRFPDSDSDNNGLMETSNQFALETKLVINRVQQTEDNKNTYTKMFETQTTDGKAKKAYDLKLFEKTLSNGNESDWTPLVFNQESGYQVTIYLNVQDLIEQGYQQNDLNLYYYDDQGNPQTPMDILRFETIDGDLHLVFTTNHFTYYVIVADDPSTPENEEVLGETEDPTPGKVELETILTDPDTGTLTTDMKSYLSIPEQWMEKTRRVETWLDVQAIENPEVPAIKVPDSILRTYDIKLMKRVTSDDGSAVESEVDPAQILHNITVRLPLDANLQAAKNLRVAVLMPDGQLAYLPSDILTIDGKSYLSFENNVLSKILIVSSGTMVEQVAAQSDFELTHKIPKTGEPDTRLAGALTLFLALASFLIFKRRKNRVN